MLVNNISYKFPIHKYITKQTPYKDMASVSINFTQINTYSARSEKKAGL